MPPHNPLGVAGQNYKFRAYEPAGPQVAPPPGHTWEGLMELALEEASRAAAMAEIPVGAVLVGPDGEILALASNMVEATPDPTAHAEILALRAGAAKVGNHRLLDCVLVSTLEPCAMCAAALVHARLAGVVFGAADVRAGAIISRADYLEYSANTHKIWHMAGVGSARCSELLDNFFRARR